MCVVIRPVGRWAGPPLGDEVKCEHVLFITASLGTPQLLYFPVSTVLHLQSIFNKLCMYLSVFAVTAVVRAELHL